MKNLLYMQKNWHCWTCC